MILLRIVSSSFVLRVRDEKLNRMTRSDVSLGMNATSEFLLPSAKVPPSGDEIEMDSTIRTGHQQIFFSQQKQQQQQQLTELNYSARPTEQ